MARQTKPPETKSEAHRDSTFDPLLSNQLDEFLRHLRDFFEDALELNLARLNSQADVAKQMTPLYSSLPEKLRRVWGHWRPVECRNPGPKSIIPHQRLGHCQIAWPGLFM